MDLKYNKDDKIINTFLGEDNKWYLKFKTRDGLEYYIERQKYIDALYEL